MNFLITGGSSGLGRSIAESLSKAYPDSKVFFTYNSSVEAAKEIEAAFPNTKAIHLDFKSGESVDVICRQIEGLNIDVLINNAVSMLEMNHFHKTPAKEMEASFIDNILPVLKITSAFIKFSRIRKSGKIITILSSYIAGMPQTGLSAYIAEKNYLLSMVKSWAAENIKFNIQSNAVSPEFMDTPLNKNVDIRLKDEMIKNHPLKKLLTSGEAAEVVRFLITAPAHLTGENIFVNSAKN
jgi:3-oxoacyl-[acyl-carrier protein] reductase